MRQFLSEGKRMPLLLAFFRSIVPLEEGMRPKIAL